MVSKDDLKKLFGKSEYEVEFFKEEGFIRKQCKVCGGFFWTKDPDRETCGDVVCEGEYRFISKNKWKAEWDIHNTIKKWTSFFEERGHEVLEPYPVVARWRDDIDFTIASIAIFQPWVVNGLVDPPANPLVVPQPCLRFGGEFSDVDNIGKTGRHLTSFTMGGQHAFNSKKLKAYWKDKYVRLNWEFHRDVLGIPEEEIVYKEDVWAGGGNFGPSLETFAYGLELVNGVFMQYKFTPDGYAPLDLKVLDVGWGLERISWFMQKTPTIYEATFGPVLDYLLDLTGVNVDLDLLVKYATLSGRIDTSSPEKFQSSRKSIAKALGMDLVQLEEILSPLEAIYAILDHTKTIVFAIPDGGIPSNVGGYYNLRVILRRAITLAEKFEFDIDWEELLHRQIDYFSKTFKRLELGREVAPAIWKEEAKRYKRTVTKGIAEINKLVKKKKIKKLTYNELKDLYINYGIPPETVSEIGKELNVEVDVPSNFYDLIRLEKIPRGEEISEIIRVDPELEYLEKNVSELPDTIPLYYIDRYMKKFSAKVLFVNGKFVVLDQTAFYPGGGGQNFDTGKLIHNNKIYRVKRAFKVKKVVVHELEDEAKDINVGDKIEGEIDWDRRYALMRHHTATHIINGAAQRILGPHVWQVGADKSPDRARLDISHFRNLSREEIAEIEDLANRIVFENRPVENFELDRTTAEKKYGIRIYQGGAIPEKRLRIVNIVDWDVEACGGTHLKSTGEVGFIKIINVKKIHDGVVRLTFVAGDRALKYVNEEERYLRDACEILRVNPEDLPKTVARFFEEWKAQNNVIKRLGNQLIELIDVLADRNSLKDYNATLFRTDMPPEFLFTALRKLSSDYETIVISSNYMGITTVIVKSEGDLLEKINKYLAKIGLKCKKTKAWYLCTGGNLDANKIVEDLKKVVLEAT